MTSPFAHTCLCGKRIPAGQRCATCEPKQTEAQRFASNPNRSSYRDPRYQKNRMRRYYHAHGLCECGCGTRLKGTLWPTGAAWECHHVPKDNPEYDHARDRDDVENLRCRYKGHHNRFTQ